MTFIEAAVKFNEFLMMLAAGIPLGPKICQLRHVINLQKGGTSLMVLFLMYWFDNWSMSAYLYLALHGTYGIVWLLKDQVMPDKGWEVRVTIPSALVAFFCVLVPYWFAAYLTVANHVEVSPLMMCLCVSVHTLGVLLMMASDAQKYFVLKVKKGLITDGWFARCRNTNYLGEMMIYGTYAVIAQHFLPWIVLAGMWGVVFTTNMWKKDLSIAKKEGGKEYMERSGLVIPKLF
eukprot:TRINITY_DN779960_c0_g1_i1.p1 TRINITY_DN779960_c0_g1~~TRINITY_DN779960_c0_g1_i1.p1  ORF type:complete len:233 (-),score=42.89 TRINITY_DN779960_c0_g1_i1:129-827(-)